RFSRDWSSDVCSSDLPEAALADRIREDTETLLRVPALIRRIEERYPPRGGAPEQPPLPEVELLWSRRRRRRGSWPAYVLSGLVEIGRASWRERGGVCG